MNFISSNIRKLCKEKKRFITQRSWRIYTQQGWRESKDLGFFLYWG